MIVANDLHISSIATLPDSVRASILDGLTEEQAAALLYDWPFWARPKQLPPDGSWRVWVLLAGRGFGKTRTGAEWVRAQVEQGGARRIALVAPTAADARDVMVEGESGVLSVSPPEFRPKFEPSKRRLTWPNGALATTYSADEPERLRGPQHDAAWCDEVASWRYPEAWDMLMFGLRMGTDPRCVVTTTPKPVKHLLDLLDLDGTEITAGSTYENRANLADAFFEQIVTRYEGTRLGRQELLAEILTDVPGALWSRAQLESLRVHDVPRLSRLVIAVDPAVTATDDSDETGIVVVGLDPVTRHAFVIDDLSGRFSPDTWAGRVARAYHTQGADRVVAEVNNGGDLVETVLRQKDALLSFRAVRAAKGKYTRAEPVAALYEQGKVHHVGVFPELEDQLCTWVPGDASPDRLDALVWALTDLMLGNQGRGGTWTSSGRRMSGQQGNGRRRR